METVVISWCLPIPGLVRSALLPTSQFFLFLELTEVFFCLPLLTQGRFLLVLIFLLLGTGAGWLG